MTVREKPDVAQLVAQGRASHACLGAEGIAVDGVELPLLEMFLFVDELQFFWWPDASWTPERVAVFFALVRRLLALAPAAYLRQTLGTRVVPSAARRCDDLKPC